MLENVGLICCDHLAGAFKTIATSQRNISEHGWLQHVARVWQPRRVATCCNMSGDVGSNLKVGRFFIHICGCFMMLYSFGQVRATMLRLGMRTSLIFNTQHVAIRR